MEHLSAEERACLTYLEETIEALEVQEDSGLSNDEPESLSQPGKTDGTRCRGKNLCVCFQTFLVSDEGQESVLASRVVECSAGFKNVS